MKARSIIITFWFNKVTDMENNIDIFEKELNEYFCSVNSTGVSSSISPEYPRLSAVSDEGCAKLNVSMVNSQLIIDFDDEYNEDFSKCFEYVKQRVLKLYCLFTENLGIDILYGGILIVCEVLTSDPMGLMKSNLLSNKLDGDYYEAGIRVARKADNKYYKSLSINTEKQFTIHSKRQELILPLVPLNDAVISKENISVSYEINDKFSFDSQNDYHLNLETLHSMFKYAEKDMPEEITNKLLIKGE